MTCLKTYTLATTPLPCCGAPMRHRPPGSMMFPDLPAAAGSVFYLDDEYDDAVGNRVCEYVRSIGPDGYGDDFVRIIDDRDD